MSPPTIYTLGHSTRTLEELLDSRRAYADYMDLAAFQTAAAQLVRLATGAPLAILCAERLPECCHRSLIADYLSLHGVRVVHLIARGEAREHLLSALARRESMQLVYDRHTTGMLDLD